MAKSNSGPMENLYRSVQRDVARARAGRPASGGTSGGTSKPRAARASSKPRAARASSKPRSSSGRNGLSSRTPAQRAAFQRMIAARGNGPSRPAGRRDAGPVSRPRAGRDDNKAWRGNPDRSRINVKEPYEVRYWSRALGVSAQDLVTTVRRLGGTPTVERVRNALLGRDRARRPPARSASRGRTGARGGRPLGRDAGYVLR